MKQTDDGFKLKVFISHQWRDKQLADRLARDLENFADIWMDYRNLRPGDRIQDTIDQVLAEMDLVLLVWTDHAKNSKGVQAEIQTSLDLGLRIIPCFFTYDDAGRPYPPLEKPLDQILGLDFHHYGSGLAQLAELILHLQTQRAPSELALGDDPRLRMLQNVKGILTFLANYRKLQNVPDERAEWVNNAIDEIERYAKSSGDVDSIRFLLEAARRSEANDPEALGIVISRLEGLLGKVSPQERAAVPAQPSPVNSVINSGSRPYEWRQPAAPPPDLLAQIVEKIVPPGTASGWLSQIDIYLKSAPAALQALLAYAKAAGSPAGAQVVTYLQSYLANGDDLIPDHQGRYGLLDDAWLILNTTFRLVESGLVPAGAVPVDWKAIISADYLVRSIIPQDALAALTNVVLQMLQVIAAEVSSYQPWFTPQGHGYAPTMAAPASAGGTWEDQMNNMLLGTGLSVDG
jgi:hypothetical protein